jgi:ankyrin repeat protein
LSFDCPPLYIFIDGLEEGYYEKEDMIRFIKLFTDHGADTSFKDRKGKTLLDIVLSKNLDFLADYLK